MFKIIIPCHGDKSENLETLISSIDNQSISDEVEYFFLEDKIETKFKEKILKYCSESNRRFFIENETKHRLYGIHNIYKFLSKLSAESIIGIMDCDDHLWGNDCIENIKSEYDNGSDCVWTANELKGVGVNFSGPLVQNCDVYEHPWVSSHFKTFKLSDFKSIPINNFKDSDGEWFESCYDQALMLPLLHNVFKRGGKTKYIDKVHYIYNGTLNPDPESRYRKSQLENEYFIRSRGYVNE